MDEDSMFDFNYPLLPDDLIAHEMNIKQALRDSSYNEVEVREIARYSDKYVHTTSQEEMQKMLYIELLSPELIKLHGSTISKDIAVVHADVEEHSGDNNDEEIENESLAGGDDYSGYYNDDDELVDENGEGNINDGATY